MTKLISADEIGQAWDHINSDWPEGRFQELKRYVKDTLHDAQAAVEALEDAARTRARPDHAKALHKLAAAVFCPPADDEADQRARKAGIGA